MSSLSNLIGRDWETMTSYEETKDVLKLTANNYSEWAPCMRAVFQVRKFWKFLYLHDLANIPRTNIIK